MVGEGHFRLFEIDNALVSDRNFEQFAAAIERPDLTEDPRFSRNPKRLENQKALAAIISESLATEDRDTWIDRFGELGMPVAPVNDLSDALSSDLVNERGLIENLPHSEVGSVPQLRSPIRYSETPVRPPTAPPIHGQHTDDILGGQLGYDTDQIGALRQSGTVK